MLGYEGYIQIGGSTVLGTGSSVPRARPRIDSSSGYGGKINGVSDAGIGAPHNYDWEQHDGSLNFEVTTGVLTTLKEWILDRQVGKSVYLISRLGNIQHYEEAFWNTISVSASDGSAVEGSVGFTAIVRDSYAYGTAGVTGYTGNSAGVAPVNPLNPAAGNVNPVPFWNTEVTLTGGTTDFITWSLDLSQEVVKFFGCSGNNPTVQEPKYLAVGPMTATFTGTYILTAPPADSIATGTIDIGASVPWITMARMELQNISDDVQSGDTLVPLNVEYAIYGLS